MNTIFDHKAYAHSVWQWLVRLLPARGSLAAHIVALALVGLAVLLRIEFIAVDAGYQYITFFPAVAIAAIVGGFWPGTLASIAGAVCAQFLRKMRKAAWCSACPMRQSNWAALTG